MALYTIGEVADLCEVNPVTLRAWQRRYGLLKPVRTDGGHRLFSDADIDRIREIKHWIEQGVQVSKVKTLLSCDSADEPEGWRERQELLLTKLRSGNVGQVRHWVSELGRDYPAPMLVRHLYTPLRRRMQLQHATLHALLSLLDGILINYVAFCLQSAWKKPGNDALVVGWGHQDATALWLEAWIAVQKGWRVDVLAQPLAQLRPELFPGKTLLVWCGEPPAARQLEQIAAWHQQGHAIFSLHETETI